MIDSIGYGATTFSKTLKPKKFVRMEAGANDIVLELLYCGVCHSDIHQVKNEWKNTVYPCVPGHEIVGRVSKVGSAVKDFKVGDIGVVGCMVDSCGVCYSCSHGDEQYCESESGMLGTYNGPLNPTGQNTYGGYSSKLVVKEHFLLHLPDNIPHEAAGPILCAGVTTYSPLKHWGIKSGMKVGVVGMGGLGHMGVQIAAAMGAEVTVISTSKDKEEDALSFGAVDFVLSTDKKQMEKAKASLDFILNTIPEKHEFEPYLELLHRDGVMVVVGVLEPLKGLNPQLLIMGRKTISGSLIGSMAETKEVLEFCSEHGIYPRVEVIEAADVNDAYKKVEGKKVRYRYVIDLASLKNEDLDKLDDIGEVGHLLHKHEAPESIIASRQEFTPEWSGELH